MLVDLGQTDSAFASAKRAVAAGEDKNLVGQLMLVESNKKFRAARQSQTRADYQEAVRLLTQADSIAPNPTISFLLGASAFSVGDQAARENQKAKSCELAQLAEDSFVTAMIHLPQRRAGAGKKPRRSCSTRFRSTRERLKGRKRTICKGSRG